MEQERLLIESISNELALQVSPAISFHKLKSILHEQINHLIRDDFNKLLLILYRLDIDEAKLKNHLSAGQEDAAVIIADLIIERQMQKIKSRQQFGRDENISDEEKW